MNNPSKLKKYSQVEVDFLLSQKDEERRKEGENGKHLGFYEGVKKANEWNESEMVEKIEQIRLKKLPENNFTARMEGGEKSVRKYNQTIDDIINLITTSTSPSSSHEGDPSKE